EDRETGSDDEVMLLGVWVSGFVSNQNRGYVAILKTCPLNFAPSVRIPFAPPAHQNLSYFRLGRGRKCGRFPAILLTENPHSYPTCCWIALENRIFSES